jgi:hypothetical protein
VRIGGPGCSKKATDEVEDLVTKTITENWAPSLQLVGSGEATSLGITGCE